MIAIYESQNNGDAQSVALDNGERFDRVICWLPRCTFEFDHWSLVAPEIDGERASWNANPASPRTGYIPTHGESDFRSRKVGPISERGLAILRSGKAVADAALARDRNGLRTAIAQQVALGLVESDRAEMQRENYEQLARMYHRQDRQMAGLA